MIVIFYTDVIVIALYTFLGSDVDELWIELRKGIKFIKAIRLKR